MNPTFFLSPAKPGKIDLGHWPGICATHRNQRHHRDKASSASGLVCGAISPARTLDRWIELVNNVWSVAG